MTEARKDSPIIQDNPPQDGNEWECQCARCGSSVYSIVCETCGGSGSTEPGDLMEEDPLFYGPGDTMACHICNGEGAWWDCMSSMEWCRDNPLKGRENIERGQVEWFTIERPKDESI